MNPKTFTFKGILYRVKTCSWDFESFTSIYYPEIFSMAGYNNWFIEHLEEHDKYILNVTDPVPN